MGRQGIASPNEARSLTFVGGTEGVKGQYNDYRERGRVKQQLAL